MSTTVETTVPSTTAASVAAPSAAQVSLLATLKAPTVPATRSEASKLIFNLIAERDMKSATQAQIGRAGALGGRDLPGAGVREKSTQIYLLEALAIWDAVDDDDAEAVSAALGQLVSRVRERFAKPRSAA